MKANLIGKYMHAITITIKKGYEFEWEKGGVYARVWKEEKKGRNFVIKLFISEIKENKNFAFNAYIFLTS